MSEPVARGRLSCTSFPRVFLAPLWGSHCRRYFTHGLIIWGLWKKLHSLIHDTELVNRSIKIRSGPQNARSQAGRLPLPLIYLSAHISHQWPWQGSKLSIDDILPFRALKRQARPDLRTPALVLPFAWETFVSSWPSWNATVFEFSVLYPDISLVFGKMAGKKQVLRKYLCNKWRSIELENGSGDAEMDFFNRCPRQHCS